MKQLKISNKITPRESYSIDKYLIEIGRIPLLKDQEEVVLKEGDEEALKTLIESNLRFVVSVAKQYQNQGMNLNDLINEGNIGLMKAAAKFDETKGFKFISYAVWWIRQSILQAIIEQPRMIRVPMNKAIYYQKIVKAISEFEQVNFREPTNEELAEILDSKTEEISSLRASLSFHVSTDKTIGDDDETTNLDLMEDFSVEAPDTFLINESMKTDIQNALHHLSEREQQILWHNLDEIAQKMDLTRERVRQLKDKALRKIKKGISKKNLNSYLS